MKYTYILTLSLLYISTAYAQIIEEKNDGETLTKTFLNSELEIIKIEKYDLNKKLVSSYEYLPGGIVKNGDFFDIELGRGKYIGNKIFEGDISYLSTNYNSDTYYISKLKIKNFRIQGEVEMNYLKNQYIDNVYDTGVVGMLNFNEDGLLNGQQAVRDKKYSYLSFYERGRPIYYRKMEGDEIIDSISFNKIDDKKNITYMINKKIVNTPEPRLVFNPFNLKVGLQNFCDSYGIFFTNDLSKLSFFYKMEFNQDCIINRKQLPENLRIELNFKTTDFINKISKSDYTFIPYIYNSNDAIINLIKNEIASIEYLNLCEFLLSKPSERFTDSDYYSYDDSNTEFSNFSELLYNLIITGMREKYGKVSWDTRISYSEFLSENLNLFKDLIYYKNDEEVYRISFEREEFKKMNNLNLKDRHLEIFRYFTNKSNELMSKFPKNLLVKDENQNFDKDENEIFRNIEIGKPNQKLVLKYLDSINFDKIQNSSLINQDLTNNTSTNIAPERENKKEALSIFGDWGSEDVNGTLSISKEKTTFWGGPFSEKLSTKILGDVMELYFESIDGSISFNNATNNDGVKNLKCKKLVGKCYLKDNILVLEGFEDVCGQIPMGKFNLEKR
jgi:hypothetical protein